MVFFMNSSNPFDSSAFSSCLQKKWQRYWPEINVAIFLFRSFNSGYNKAPSVCMKALCLWILDERMELELIE